ncbi:hypothetical protein MLD52_09960 [Puniceicoccaceae bacterium K14]|nr:hypothetical protein [Puniceicoccaceae bacterium K14]
MFRIYFLLVALIFASARGAEKAHVIESIDELRASAVLDDVKVRMKPGTYRLDEADDHHFIRFTGSRSHFDLTGVTLEIDNALFRKFGVINGPDGFYCAIDLIGDDIVFEGLSTVNVGDGFGVSGRNKIFNVCGSGVILRNVDVTTSGSNPWGYGSLFGIAGGDVRKMNGIRVGWPAVGAKLINCRVHMRAMGHAIFVQGAQDTLIDDCHVDGLLRPTDEILEETSGYAFDKGFNTGKSEYVEGVLVAENGDILPSEMIAMSEDGIRLYPQGGPDKTPTGVTTLRNCTVSQMRRGICVGLGNAADIVIDCEVRNCVAAGFNISGGDYLENCRSDARYSEALSCPYNGSEGAVVGLEILDSRGGTVNTLLATLNGRGHEVTFKTANPLFVPESFRIEKATKSGYAYYQRKKKAIAESINILNETPAMVFESE